MLDKLAESVAESTNSNKQSMESVTEAIKKQSEESKELLISKLRSQLSWIISYSNQLRLLFRQ